MRWISKVQRMRNFTGILWEYSTALDKALSEVIHLSQKFNLISVRPLLLPSTRAAKFNFFSFSSTSAKSVNFLSKGKTLMIFTCLCMHPVSEKTRVLCIKQHMIKSFCVTFQDAQRKILLIAFPSSSKLLFLPNTPHPQISASLISSTIYKWQSKTLKQKKLSRCEYIVIQFNPLTNK